MSLAEYIYTSQPNQHVFRDWNEYFRLKQMPKERHGKGKDMIFTKNIGSIFDRLYGDIYSVITNYL